MDLYERGDSKENPLICLDEKSVFLSEDSKEAILMSPGNTQKVDYEYKRNGRANVFFAVEPFDGFYKTEVTNRRTKKDFAYFLKRLSKKYHSAKKISLVMDNLNTHNKSSLEETFGKKEADKLWSQFKIYYTPKHASLAQYGRNCNWYVF